MKVAFLSFSLGAALAAFAPSFAGAVSSEDGFLAQTKSAMATMMTAMDVVPSGDVDADFVAAMVPHHQGAIDMAAAELRFGRNSALRRISQEIIVTQQDEIVAMHRALGRP
jgi:uncharacterized protein (DUF305 family)